MALYSGLLLFSIAVPFILSFDKKLQFYKKWNYLLPSLLLVAAVYIACDVYLTKIGVWGFNARYHSNILFFNLPIEEWLFFIVIPYASIFIHESFILYFPSIQLSNKYSRIVSFILIFMLSIIVLLNTDKIYTVYIFMWLIISIILSFFDKSKTINQFYVTFLIILIPFLLVNAILTGSFIEQEVVWYNDNENLGIRVFTIPIEDFGYAFSLILFNLLLFKKFQFSNRVRNNK